MSEIEKMYENAEVKKQIPKVCSSNELYCKECEAHIEDAMSYCKNAEYPPFTAEKQIELIKWLARKGLLQINYSSHQCYQFNSFRVGGDYKSNLSEALASHCNNLWQDLTEEEKQQVKGILE